MEAASAPRDPCDDSLLNPEPDLVLIYEKLGNLPAAEILQERRLLLMTSKHWSGNAVISPEAKNLFRLYTFFLTRVENLNVMATPMVLLMVFYRIAVLGCSLLNAILFSSELWTRCNPELCLHIAIGIQSIEMIHVISIGVDINKSSDDWSPPLLTAAQYGNLECLELLLAKSVDVEAETLLSQTALHLAILRDAKQSDETYKIICCLIEAGVDIHAVDTYSRTALHSAVVHDPELEEKVICRLIEAGVDIEAEDWNDVTALGLAVIRGYLITVRLLLQKGANIEYRWVNGETPLFCALRNGNRSMAELLLDHDANIEAENQDGDTPLHQAVLCNEIELVTMLLDKGASATAYNKLGKTPVDLARSYGDQNVVDLLLEYNQ